MSLIEPIVESLEREECVALLATVGVGRVIYTEHALPAVVPVPFVVEGEAVVFRTSAASQLAERAPGAVVALQADDLDPAMRSGWSVLVTGVAGRVAPGRERERVVARWHPWVPGQRDCVLRLPMSVLTGRRIVRDAFPGA